MAMRKAKIKALAVFCATGMAVSIAAVAHGQNEDPPPGEGIAQVTTIEEDAIDAMAVLKGTRAATDEMPTGLADVLDAEADFGMNPDLSRRPIANLTNSVYVVPGNDYVCAALTDGDGASIGCAETGQVAEGEVGPTTVNLESGDIAVYGIVPDGVDTVTVDTGVSSSQTVEVGDNAYYTVFAAETAMRAVRYTGPSGEVEFPIYDPALVFEEE